MHSASNEEQSHMADSVLANHVTAWSTLMYMHLRRTIMYTRSSRHWERKEAAVRHSIRAGREVVKTCHRLGRIHRVQSHSRTQMCQLKTASPPSDETNKMVEILQKDQSQTAGESSIWGSILKVSGKYTVCTRATRLRTSQQRSPTEQTGLQRVQAERNRRSCKRRGWRRRCLWLLHST